MIRDNSCFDCRHLFKLSGNNRIEFCNGREGAFIDSYPDKRSLFKHFEAFKTGCKNRHTEHSRDYDNRFSQSSLSNPKGLAQSSNDLGYLADSYSRIFCFPTLNCNNACRHCLAADGLEKKNLTLEEAKGMIRRHEKKFSYVHIGGGEPTLFKDLVQLIIFCRKLGKKVRLFSNCRRMSEFEFAKRIADSGLDALMVPLHSWLAKTHDYMTRRKGSFKETVQGMDNLKKLGIKDIQVMVVVHKKNYRELEKTAKFLVRKNVSGVSVESLIYCGRAIKNFNCLKIKVSKSVKAIEKFFDILIDANIPVSTTSLPLCLFNKRYWRIFLNERYSLMATNIGQPADYNFHEPYRTAGTGLCEKCIDCKLKLFCPGLWVTYYKFFGDAELTPFTNGVLPSALKFVSFATLEKIFRPVQARAVS